MSTVARQLTRNDKACPGHRFSLPGSHQFVASMVANLIVRAIAVRVFDIPNGFDPLATIGPLVLHR